MTDDTQRYLIVKGRRWRLEDPALPEEVARSLRSYLGRGRSGVAAARRAGTDPAPHRRRVDAAKHGLGERGTPWWEQSEEQRSNRWEHALTELEQMDHQDGPTPDR